MNLLNLYTRDVTLIVKGIVAAYNRHDTIDPEYELHFATTVKSNSTLTEFVVSYSWFTGMKKPIIESDPWEKVQRDGDSFNVNSDADISELVDKVYDAIEQVTANKFEPLLHEQIS